MKRYIPLDILRGISIFGMVFSAIIPYGVLPYWMYHIQTPPPSHQFDPSISGISWVDMVFPIFIFCMGVAIPIANRKKMDGVDFKRDFLIGTFKRFLMLWLFSYLYVITNFSNINDWRAQLLTLFGFFGLFMLYLILPKKSGAKQGLIIRVISVFIIGVTVALGYFIFDRVVTVHRSGIIIFLLAFLYLFGALIWFYTKSSLKNRFIVWVGLIALAAVTMPFEIQQYLYSLKEIRWFFNLESLYFLIILVPATVLGDRLYIKLTSGSIKEMGNIGRLKMWYLNNRVELLSAFVLMLIGIIFYFIEGSISKSPCTISFCLVSLSISMFLLFLIDIVVYKESHVNNWIVKIFSGAGSNPLLSYVAFGNLVIPFFKLTGFIYIYNALYPSDMPWIGVLRAALFVLLTMKLVSILSDKKVFWRA